MASVTESLGRDRLVPTFKLVVVAEVIVVLARTVFVVKVIAPLANCISAVPVTAVALW